MPISSEFSHQGSLKRNYRCFEGSYNFKKQEKIIIEQYVFQKYPKLILCIFKLLYDKK